MKHNKLDLHGVRHHEVRNKVIRLVEDNWGEGLNVEIITGNSDEMKSIVGNVLNSSWNISGFFGMFRFLGMLRLFSECLDLILTC